MTKKTSQTKVRAKAPGKKYYLEYKTGDIVVLHYGAWSEVKTKLGRTGNKRNIAKGFANKRAVQKYLSTNTHLQLENPPKAKATRKYYLEYLPKFRVKLHHGAWPEVKEQLGAGNKTKGFNTLPEVEEYLAAKTSFTLVNKEDFGKAFAVTENTRRKWKEAGMRTAGVTDDIAYAQHIETEAKAKVSKLAKSGDPVQRALLKMERPVKPHAKQYTRPEIQRLWKLKQAKYDELPELVKKEVKGVYADKSHFVVSGKSFTAPRRYRYMKRSQAKTMRSKGTFVTEYANAAEVLRAAKRDKFKLTNENLVHAMLQDTMANRYNTTDEAWNSRSIPKGLQNELRGFDYKKSDISVMPMYVYEQVYAKGHYWITGYKELNGETTVQCKVCNKTSVHKQDYIGKHQCKETRSQYETRVHKYLNDLGVQFITEFDTLRCYAEETRMTLPYDIELSGQKLLIEVQGEQHLRYVPSMHKTKAEFEKRVEYDKHKKEFAESKGYKVLYLYPDDLRNSETIHAGMERELRLHGLI